MSALAQGGAQRAGASATKQLKERGGSPPRSSSLPALSPLQGAGLLDALPCSRSALLRDAREADRGAGLASSPVLEDRRGEVAEGRAAVRMEQSDLRLRTVRALEQAESKMMARARAAGRAEEVEEDEGEEGGDELSRSQPLDSSPVMSAPAAPSYAGPWTRLKPALTPWVSVLPSPPLRSHRPGLFGSRRMPHRNAGPTWCATWASSR